MLKSREGHSTPKAVSVEVNFSFVYGCASYQSAAILIVNRQVKLSLSEDAKSKLFPGTLNEEGRAA